MAKRNIRPITVIGSLAFVPLTQGRAAMIDVADVPLVEGHNWCLVRPNQRYTPYAARRGNVAKDGKTRVLFHQAILPEAKQVDHVNGNGLDNRRCNLRACTSSQNQQNQNTVRRGSSIYKGVTFHRKRGAWQANIRVNKKLRYLGLHKTEAAAARSYDSAALEFFGPFARTNFPSV